MAGARVGVALCLSSLLANGCSRATGPSMDAGADVTATSEVGPEASAERTDAEPDGGCRTLDGPFHDIASAGCWSVFDVGYLALGEDAPYLGGTFDGRYVYFAPSSLGSVVQYDTTRAFDAASSWRAFDTLTLPARPWGYMGAIFDGRYAYFVPQGSVVARYDTDAPFGASSSWSTFDTSVFAGDAETLGFNGATFDGRYLYFVPSQDGAMSGSIILRYDTHASFTRESAWTAFDVATLSPKAAGFAGGIFDGRYVYLMPSSNGAGADGLVVRYDTKAPGFTSAQAWTMLDLTRASPMAEGFSGGGFDGQYVYFVPGSSFFYLGLVVRYDTHAPFIATALTTFDLTTLSESAVGFVSADFDGRFVYFVPGFHETIGASGSSEFTDGLVVRYDTSQEFEASTAWSLFDTDTAFSKPNGGTAGGYGGSVFDGRYLYLPPNLGTLAARFDARAPAATPRIYGDAGPAFYGSFY